MAKEEVNHPQHYNCLRYNDVDIECIDFIEYYNLDFSLGNAIKYLWRADHKGTKSKDIQKALWYQIRSARRHDVLRPFSDAIIGHSEKATLGIYHSAEKTLNTLHAFPYLSCSATLKQELSQYLDVFT